MVKSILYWLHEMGMGVMNGSWRPECARIKRINPLKLYSINLRGYKRHEPTYQDEADCIGIYCIV